MDIVFKIIQDVDTFYRCILLCIKALVISGRVAIEDTCICRLRLDETQCGACYIIA